MRTRICVQGVRVTVVALAVFLISCGCGRDTRSQVDHVADWMIGPFTKLDAANPCLVPDGTAVFDCPVRRADVHWEAKDVFNPAVIGMDSTLWMIYRAEDNVGRYAGTSRLGRASSLDGKVFTKTGTPVLYPDHDGMYQYEWEGGCEDPRIVRRQDGLYVLTYTSYDGVLARLCVASSDDLRTWTKHGLAFASAGETAYTDMWSKSGAIVAEYDAGGSITARQVNGTYWMYWGDKAIYLAKSNDLLHWKPVVDSAGKRIPVLEGRQGMFDNDLVEPGPPAVLTDRGIVLIYNSRNYGEGRDTLIPEDTYSAGQALFDPQNPMRLLERADAPFLIPDRDYEISGQVNRVVFLEGLVRWNARWFLYYGTADSKIAVAEAQDTD